MLYILALIIAIAISSLGFMLYQNKMNQVRVFDSREELTAFLRKKYTSEVKSNQPIHGFVLDEASLQITLQDPAMASLGRSAIDVQVNLVTKDCLLYTSDAADE